MLLAADGRLRSAPIANKPGSKPRDERIPVGSQRGIWATATVRCMVTHEESDGSPLPDIGDIHRAVGAVIAATTRLEWTLADAVASLTRSPLASVLVQGERGSTLTQMAKRLLLRGIGSTAEDERSGRTSRLKLVSLADTNEYLRVLKEAERLMKERDELAHSLWLANIQPGSIQAHRKTRSSQTTRDWTVAEIDSLRQSIANVDCDIFICSWNTSGSGMERIEPRQGDVSG
jgi:hypothetical protein